MWDLVAFFGFPSELRYQPSEEDKDFKEDIRREFGEFINTKGTVKTGLEPWNPSKTTPFTDKEVQIPADEYHKEQWNLWLQIWILFLYLDYTAPDSAVFFINNSDSLDL